MELPYGETGNDFDQIVLRRVVSAVDQAWILSRSQALSIEHENNCHTPHMIHLSFALLKLLPIP